MSVTPVHKKGRQDLKDNYGPISIFQSYLKNIRLDKSTNFSITFFLIKQCGFRSECLMLEKSSRRGCINSSMLEKLKASADKGKSI